ncbi:MAG: helix-turn-helix domain-containing protein [Oscillospiraceae bacterium]|jgi:transcriptional regulator with XRE-family HTH domain|nr:helix-turn-helix domain-containing protein [Oscillospiraceae bacterium]
MENTFNLGEKLKALRKRRDLTQEQLAETLGVSFQAVSKWETNAAYPDISLFPIIANFYGVTTDELLGVDISKAKEKVQAYIAEINSLHLRWKEDETIALCRKACLEFPGNLELMFNLAVQLRWFADGSPESYDEPIAICKKILEDCTDTELRTSVTVTLAGCYHGKDDKATALEFAEQLPPTGYSRQVVIGTYALKEGKEGLTYAQWLIQYFYEFLTTNVKVYADVDCWNPEQKIPFEDRIAIYEQLLQLQGIIYGENMCDQHFDAYEYNRVIAACYLLMKRYDETLDYLERAYVHAEKYAAYTDGDEYTSLMLRGITAEPHSRWSRSPFEDMLDRFTEQERYDPLRGEPRFIALLEKVKARAGA